MFQLRRASKTRTLGFALVSTVLLGFSQASTAAETAIVRLDRPAHTVHRRRSGA